MRVLLLGKPPSLGHRVKRLARESAARHASSHPGIVATETITHGQTLDSCSVQAESCGISSQPSAAWDVWQMFGDSESES